MQLVRVILHGSLKGRYPELEVAASCAADAIEGWSRQCGFADIPVDDRPVVQVVGHDSKEALDERKKLSEIHIIPAMFGGGGVAKIVIGAALVAVGIILLPTNPVLGTALIINGAGFIIGGAMELFMKAPSSKGSKDPPNSKYMNGGKNTTAIGTPIGFGGGRTLIGGQFLSVQVNAIDMVYGKFPTTVS